MPKYYTAIQNIVAKKTIASDDNTIHFLPPVARRRSNRQETKRVLPSTRYKHLNAPTDDLLSLRITSTVMPAKRQMAVLRPTIFSSDAVILTINGFDNQEKRIAIIALPKRGTHPKQTCKLLKKLPVTEGIMFRTLVMHREI